MRIIIQPHYTAEIVNDHFYADYTGDQIFKKKEWEDLVMADVPEILINLPSSVYYGMITIRDPHKDAGEMYMEWRRPRKLSSVKDLITATIYTSGKSGRTVKKDITSRLIDEVTRLTSPLCKSV